MTLLAQQTFTGDGNTSQFDPTFDYRPFTFRCVS